MTSDKTPCNVLFVVLPDKETLTARKLPQRLTADYIRAKLELATGIHGNAMQLVYGEVLVTEDADLCFGENLRNGGLMKVLVADQLLDLYLAVCESDPDKVIQRCRQQEAAGCPQTADSADDVVLSSEDKKFFSLLLACKQGSLDVIRAIINLDKEGLWKKQCTRFRRTLTHIAAAADQTKTLEFLLEQGAPVKTADCFGNTPLDVATSQGAYACERLIRQALTRRKSVDRQLDQKTTTKKARSKVCWRDTNSNKENAVCSRAGATVQLYGVTPLGSGVVCGTPLVSSRRTSANATPSSPRARGKQDPDAPPYKDQTASRSADRRGVYGRKVGRNHRRCTTRPPFMAFRSVPQEELRPVTVEYVPLPASSPTAGRRRRVRSDLSGFEQPPDFPKAPCSSLNNSAEDLTAENCLSERELILQKRNEVMRRYTKINGITSRAQSAKYYRTKYHIEAEYDASIPKPRPATAGPRYREWKTWLLDQIEQEAEKAKTSYVDAQRRKLNETAYRKWLASHRNRHPNGHVSDDDDDQSSDDDEEKREAREEAYRTWMESKKEVFEELDKRRSQILKADVCSETTDKCIQRDRRLAVFEIGACVDEPTEPSKPDRYIRAYQTWIRNKKNYENWKRRNGLAVDEKRTLTREEFIRARDTLLLDGMTYNEWLGLKTREHNTNKLHLHKF